MRMTPHHPAAKLIQFTYQLAFGGAFHYIPYYYKHYRHYTSAQIGMLQAISFIVSFPACILTARIADAWKLRRRVLVVEAVLTSILIATLALQYNIYWTGVVVTVIFISTNKEKYTRFDVLNIIERSTVLNRIGLYTNVHAPMIPIGDTLTLDLLGDEKEQYGRQRVWGAIAAGIASLFTGFLIEKTKSYIPFFSMFGIYSVFFIAAILFSFVSNKTTAKEKPREDEILQDMEVIDPNHPDIAVDHVALGPALMSAISTDTPRVRHWLLHRDVFAFYFTIIICNMSLYCFQTFIWLYMETYLGATKAQTGYTAPFQILVELPFFFYSDKILEIIGVKNSLLLAHVSLAIRFLIYPTLPQTSMQGTMPGGFLVGIMGIELLHGLAFACMWNAAVRYADLMAPANRATTSQGVLGAMVAVGGSAGNLLGGYLFQRNPALMFWVFAGLNVVSALLYLAVPMRNLTPMILDASKIEEKNMQEKKIDTTIFKPELV